MSVVISGALIDGAGISMSGCHIILKSRVNTSEVVMRTVADVVTGNCGEYCFKAQTGKYCVYLKQDWRDEYCVGDIAVYDDSKPGTLNDFLTALDEGDLKPDVVKRFEELVAQAQQSAEAAAGSAQEAGKHAASLEEAKERVETLAGEVKQNADAVAEDKRLVENLASRVEDTAKEVRQDTEAAKQAASDAEQARADIDTALSATLRTANRLSELADEGEEAQQESRDNLGLKTAATMDVQTNLYDSTEGHVALPGAFGYGMTEAGSTAIIVSDMATVARAAHNLHPGRYYTFSTQTEETTGITEIIWLDNGWGDKTSRTATKLVLFFGKDGRILMTVRGDNISAPVTWTNLTPQLGNAAQKDAQENIYDRTEGRLAIPGMFGFGKVFSSDDRTEFKTEVDFLRWVKTAKPGRYVVYGADKVIPGVLFSGTVEIIWPEPQANPYPASMPKIIIFYGTGGHIYYNRYWPAGNSYLIGWESLKVTPWDIITLLSGLAPGTTDTWYGTGSLVLAAYRGRDSSDQNRQIRRGYSYSGSRLSAVEFKAPLTSLAGGVYSGAVSAYFRDSDTGLAGSYRALSGDMMVSADTGGVLIGLFIRVS